MARFKQLRHKLLNYGKQLNTSTSNKLVAY